MTELIQLCGRVTRLGYYRDTLPKLVIAIKKVAADFPFDCMGKRKSLQLYINGETYQAGIRTTPKAKTITICPDLLDKNGNQVRLSDLLLCHNVQQRATVNMVWHAMTLVLV